MKLISACLCGCPCRYDGKHSRSETVVNAIESGALLVCPEALGGLTIPRPPAELLGGDGAAVLDGTARVIRIGTGEDVTEAFLRGAEAVVALARNNGVTEAVLKSKSPSCGVNYYYESGSLKPGMGVTAAALARAGVVLQEADRDREKEA